jgi:putative aldouronate transport system substrate-binding protein
MYINAQWLENLELDMPHDSDSFYEVMKAFKEKDADADGDPNNEVPLIFAGGNIIPVDDILPYFGFYTDNFSSWAIAEDGSRVEYYAITDRYKEGLSYLTKLYEEGIMHKDSLTLTHDQVESMAQTGTAIGCFVAWDPQYTIGAYDPSLPYEENLVTQYKAMPPWDGAKATSASTLQSAGMYITDKCERPEVVVAWADLLYSEETTVLSNFGVEGETYRLLDGNKIELINIDGMAQSDTNPHLLTLGGATAGPYKRYADGYEMYYDTEANPYIRYVNEVNEEWKKAGKKYDPWPAYKLTTEEAEESSDILADAEPYRTQYRAEVITGVKDLDSTWDEYIETMKEMRIQTVIDNVNAAYQRFLDLDK